MADDFYAPEEQNPPDGDEFSAFEAAINRASSQTASRADAQGRGLTGSCRAGAERLFPKTLGDARPLVNMTCTRCEGDGVQCFGAGACSMVGHSCVPCNGQCRNWKEATE